MGIVKWSRNHQPISIQHSKALLPSSKAIRDLRVVTAPAHRRGIFHKYCRRLEIDCGRSIFSSTSEIHTGSGGDAGPAVVRHSFQWHITEIHTFSLPSSSTKASYAFLIIKLHGFSFRWPYVELKCLTLTFFQPTSAMPQVNFSDNSVSFNHFNLSFPFPTHRIHDYVFKLAMD